VDSAVRQGFTNAETHALLDDARERRHTREEAERTLKAGVRGVPLYVINSRESVSGAQAPSVFRGAIERALAAVA
jgi:predicted DsbA family dithiol-disulfide isomerase